MEEERYGVYDEEDIKNFSKASEVQEVDVSQIFKKSQNRSGHRRTYIRKQTSMYLAEEAMNVIGKDQEEEQMELNGDYLVKKALLKEHDIQLLRTKEMQHVLSNCCRIHIGKDEKATKIIQIYK
jgi:hypothetical protein